MLANLFLIAFYALQASHPENGTWLGSANDLVGSLGTAFMIPVTLALSAWLPDRRLSRITLLVGLPALAVLTVGGPLLVLGVMVYKVQAPIMVAAWMVLSLLAVPDQPMGAPVSCPQATPGTARRVLGC